MKIWSLLFRSKFESGCNHHHCDEIPVTASRTFLRKCVMSGEWEKRVGLGFINLCFDLKWTEFLWKILLGVESLLTMCKVLVIQTYIFVILLPALLITAILAIVPSSQVSTITLILNLIQEPICEAMFWFLWLSPFFALSFFCSLFSEKQY